MARNLIYISIFFLFTVFSCKKEETIIFEGTYESSNTFTLTPPVMYVKNMAIHDTSVINTFLRLHGDMDHFYYTPIQTMNQTFLALQFGANNTVSIKRHTDPDFLNGFRVNYGAGEMILSNMDTLKIAIPPPGSTFLECDIVPVTKSYIYSADINGIRYIVGKMPLLFTNNELKVSAVTISAATHSPTQDCVYRVSNHISIKLPNIPATVGDNDTAVVQEKIAVMYKVQ